jgi:putative ABC transport system substrate-binding protein
MVVVLLGGFASYGIDNHDLCLSAMSYVDCILKGEKPADLPIQTPTKLK